MGKGGRKKRERRIAETYAEIEEALSERVEAAALASRDSDTLFVVDRTGSKNARRKIAKKEASDARAYSVSKVDDKLIKKKITAKKREETAVSAKTTGVFDLWNDDVLSKTTANIVQEVTQQRATMPAKSRTLRRKVAGPGFSYNPDHNDHQDLLAEALALELQALEKKARAEGTLNLNNAVAQDEGNSDSNDEGSNSGYDSANGDIVPEGAAAADADSGRVPLSRKQRKALERKTRAQRNKEKEKKRRLHELQKTQRIQQLIKGLKSVPSMIHELDKAAQIAEAGKAIKEMRDEEQKEREANALSYQEAGNVPLSDELGDSLRTLRPKGSRLKGLQADLIASKDAIAKDHRRLKKGEHPHRAKNIKWHAKHKYT